MAQPESSPATRPVLLALLRRHITPAWAHLPAHLERVRSSERSDRLVLRFYDWDLALELADYPAGGVLITASLAPRSVVGRAARALASPAQGVWAPIARQIVADTADLAAAVEMLSLAIRRHRTVAPHLARRWPERGMRVGVE